jgi:hypothetical protein
VYRLDVAGERVETGAIARGGRLRHLNALSGRALQERWLHIEACSIAIRPRELPVDEHGTAGILATWTAFVGRNQAIDRDFDQYSLVGGEEHPGARTHRDRRRRHS